MMSMSLKLARIATNKTQEEMAILLGIHPQTYRRIERNPNLATISQAKMISEITGISYDEIFFAPDSTLSRRRKMTKDPA